MSITTLVNKELVPIARRYHKRISAAVFPNWENVRQQWPGWNLDVVLPMLYHSFYRQDISWIREQVQKGLRSLKKKVPLYSGLFVPALKPEELERAIRLSLEGRAGGVSLFSMRSMTEEHWQAFRRGIT